MAVMNDGEPPPRDIKPPSLKTMFKPASLVSLICALGLEPAQAVADPGLLSLKHAEELAALHHPRISAAELNALAAKEVTKEARSAFFPTLSANATAVGAADDNTRIAAGGLNNPVIYDRNAEGLTITQIITDFGRTANLTASARLRVQAAEANVTVTRAQLLLQVDTAYFNVLAAQAVLRVSQETVNTRKLLLDQVSALATNKLRSELDVSFARVAYEEGRLLLSRAANDLKAGWARLAALIGTPEEKEFHLVEEETPDAVTADDATLIEQALQQRPELSQLCLERDAALKFAKAERALRYPTIAAVGSVGVVPLHDEHLPDNYAAAGVNLNLPLYTGGLYSARQAEAELRSKVAEERLRDEENSVIQEVRVALLHANNALERMRITEQLLAQADLSFNLAQARFKIGSSSIVELSQAQLNQTAAQIAQASAKYEYQIRHAALDYETGAKK